MKTITALLTATILVSGAASAMAGQQGSNQSTGYALSWQMSRGSAVHAGPYASASRGPDAGREHGSAVSHHVDGDQNTINFQAQGSN